MELAPSEIAAFSICGSSRCSAAHTDSTMKGISTCASATTMPVSREHEGHRREIRSPSDMSALFKIPVAAEQQRPAQRARDDRDQQRPEDDQQEDAAPRRRHAVQDVGLGRAEQQRQHRDRERDAKRPQEHLEEIAVGRRPRCQFLRMKTGSMPLYCPQSWNESSTVAPSGTRSRHRHTSSAGPVSR